MTFGCLRERGAVKTISNGVLFALLFKEINAVDISMLRYEVPEEQIACRPAIQSRILEIKDGVFQEIGWADLWRRFSPGDLVVINETQVMPRRIFSLEGMEVLFVNEIECRVWEVLFMARDFKVGDTFEFPEGVLMTLTQKGIPQKVKVNVDLDADYFGRLGRLPLPPYIVAARGEASYCEEDSVWYQTEWARVPGSLAAPTASLHFSKEDWDYLRQRGVQVAPLTLHVGLGTFLPIKTERLEEHKMHFEEVMIPRDTWEQVEATRNRGAHVWAVGTTALRALEACAAGHLERSASGFEGKTDLYITPGFKFKVVDRLLTNFHQPQTTLLALVYAFSGDHKLVQRAYQWAISQGYRLFSYGDLSLWYRS